LPGKRPSCEDAALLPGWGLAVTTTQDSAAREYLRAYPFGPSDRLELHPLYAYLREHEPLCRVRLPYGEEAWLVTYMAGLVGQRRREPTDDLLGALVLARDEGDRLTEQELISLAMTLLAGGHETTANQIANSVYLLLTHPDQLALLRSRPEPIPGAVEEMMRFVPLAATAGTPRYATADVELTGGTVPAGDAVLVFVPAANRDPRVFPDPDRLDVTRGPAAQLALGHGAHHCLGAGLARMELQVALGSLLERFPGLRLAVDKDELRWKAGTLVRGPLALPVAW